MRNKRTKWILGGLAVVIVLVVGAGLTYDYIEKAQRRAAREERLERIAQVFEPVMPVCDGRSVPEAAAYSKQAGVHPTALLRDDPSGDGWYVAHSDFPTAWEPQRLEEIELVACIQTDKIPIETCPYQLNDGRSASIERIQYQTNVTLYEAQTGAVVANTILIGTMPSECSDQVSFKEDELTRKQYGKLPADEEIEAWLRPYIE